MEQYILYKILQTTSGSEWIPALMLLGFESVLSLEFKYSMGPKYFSFEMSFIGAALMGCSENTAPRELTFCQALCLNTRIPLNFTIVFI